MTFNEYQKTAFEFALPKAKSITYMVLGVANESGEVAGKLKKYFRGDERSQSLHDEIAAELGDCLWYLAGLASMLQMDLSEIAQRNIDKLRSRQGRGKLTGSGDER
jgi:NTP pyrophosphatase (non-canonical NTP hydrolase)